MIAVVSIDEDGAVAVTVDSDDTGPEDEPRLSGYVLDHILDRAADTAYETWIKLRTEDVTEAGE